MSTQDFYAALASEIISEQEMIIGPLAREQARQVPGLRMSETSGAVEIHDQPKRVIDALVGKYETLFGKASVRICHLAASRVMRKYSLPQDALPERLRG